MCAGKHGSLVICVRGNTILGETHITVTPAHLDIKASGFWGSRFEPTFFDVRIFNPYAPSNRCNPYRQHETSKRRQYEERVREVEHGNFSPLVFSTSGGMGASTTMAYKRLAFFLSVETGSGHPGHIFSGSDPVYNLSGSDPDWIT